MDYIDGPLLRKQTGRYCITQWGSNDALHDMCVCDEFTHQTLTFASEHFKQSGPKLASLAIGVIKNDCDIEVTLWTGCEARIYKRLPWVELKQQDVTMRFNAQEWYLIMLCYEGMFRDNCEHLKSGFEQLVQMYVHLLRDIIQQPTPCKDCGTSYCLLSEGENRYFHGVSRALLLVDENQVTNRWLARCVEPITEQYYLWACPKIRRLVLDECMTVTSWVNAILGQSYDYELHRTKLFW